MITIEQIDEFRKRTNSSYSDAKYFLEKNNGNILDAIIDFERTKAGSASNQNNRQHNDMGERFADFLQKGFDTRVIVEDKETVLFSVPVILLIILIPLWLVVVLFFAFFAVLGYKFRIQEISTNGFDVHSFLKNINAKMKEQSSFKQQKPNNNTASDNTQENKNTGNFNTAETSANDSSGQKFDDDDDDDYNEFIVE